MKRLQPDQVLNAYKQTGLVPRTCMALSHDKTRACALGAVAMFQNPGYKGGTDNAIKELGLDTGYGWGFSVGFDGCGKLSVDWPEHEQGRTDGQAALEAVVLKYGPIARCGSD